MPAVDRVVGSDPLLGEDPLDDRLRLVRRRARVGVEEDDAVVLAAADDHPRAEPLPRLLLELVLDERLAERARRSPRRGG